MATVYDEFHKAVLKSPDAIAVVDGERELTYKELDLLTEPIAGLVSQGHQVVGIVTDHGAAMVACMLGVLRAGAAYVPAEPDFPKERIAFMMGESGADLIITEPHYADAFPDVPMAVWDGEAEALQLISPDVGRSRKAPLCRLPQPQSLAYVLYTSGTTGVPKGVAVEQGNICSYVEAFRHEFHPAAGDRMLQYSVCSFDIFVEEVYTTLLSGATLVIAPKCVRDDAAALAAFIDASGVTIVDGFPYLLEDLNSLGRRPQGVRLYISGGDVLRASQVSNLIGDATVYNTYGPSETTCCASYMRRNGRKPAEDGTYPIGKAISGYDIQLVDSNLQPVARGEVGEILISGRGVSRGYLGTHPEQENFTVDETGHRAYLSGDMARELPDGNLLFLHRKDDQVMIGGKRVEAKEVENVLMQEEGIHKAAVVPRTDDAGFSYLTAYIVPEGQQVGLTALKESLSLKLAPFMIPEFFVQLGEIPLNSHGKTDVEALPVVLKGGER